MTWKWMAQRALTGEWLHRDLPLRDVKPTWNLNAPDAFTATLDPERLDLVAGDGRPVLDEWGTWLYGVEEDIIRWGGIVTPSAFASQAWTVNAQGVVGYATGIDYDGHFTADSVDPLDVVRELWRYLVEYSKGGFAPLNVVVDQTKSPVRLGKSPKHVQFTTGQGEQVDFTASQAFEIAWWSSTDCGQEMNTLASQTPFDYREAHTWQGDDVEHRIVLGYPRLGTRRTDLRFALGENIAEVPGAARPSDLFCNESLGLGAGEGSAMKRVRIAQPDGRFRRPHKFSQPGVTDIDRLTQLCRMDLRTRNPDLDVTEVVVRDHPNAPLGSLQAGDDIYMTGRLPWLGAADLWLRITSRTWDMQASTATLTVARSDSFTYGEVTSA